MNIKTEGNESTKGSDNTESDSQENSDQNEAAPLSAVQQAMNNFGPKLQELRQVINTVIIGQEDVVDQLLVTMLSSGHLLLEGVPGLGKTLLIRTVAHFFQAHFKRIQFTPDLMPADITGHTLYDMQEGKFRMRRGPIFTQFLLADEINRAPAKTQAALLEVMGEMQVTIEGESIKLPPPFMVLATQNPLEQEGTYPLPEAELDRFLLKVVMDYPNEEDENLLTRNVVDGHVQKLFESTKSASGDTAVDESAMNAIFSSKDIIRLQTLCDQITLDDQLIDYAVRLTRATRESEMLVQGAGPRASIGLVKAARAKALLEERDYVLPDDIKALYLPVLRHRITVSAESEIDGLKADDILALILKNTEAPR